MKKQKIHWFGWDCINFNNGPDSYTDVPGLVTCKRCEKKLKAYIKQHTAEQDRLDNGEALDNARESAE